MRTRIAVDLATGHGGDVEVALLMVEAAAAAGADAVKIQHYGAVNPNDRQATWLEQSRLSFGARARVQDAARVNGVEFWATPFNAESLSELVHSGVDRIKIASTESSADWWPRRLEHAVVSWPWGMQQDDMGWPQSSTHLTAIPLYPTPLECVSRAPLLDGWSDHTIGLAACQRAIVLGAQWLEVHLTLGEGQSRVMAWDKTPDQIRQLRTFAEEVETMQTGSSQVFRDRWLR